MSSQCRDSFAFAFIIGCSGLSSLLWPSTTIGGHNDETDFLSGAHGTDRRACRLEGRCSGEDCQFHFHIGCGRHLFLEGTSVHAVRLVRNWDVRNRLGNVDRHRCGRPQCREILAPMAQRVSDISGAVALSNCPHPRSAAANLPDRRVALGLSDVAHSFRSDGATPAEAGDLRDRQILEQLLRIAQLHDPEGTSSRLLEKHGSLAEALVEASDNRWDETATLLAAVRDTMLQALRAPLRHHPILSTSAQVLDFLSAALADQVIEVVWALFLDSANGLLHDEIVSKGSISQASIYPRQLIKRALDIGATGLILAHNHPSGLPVPSDADIRMTSRIVRACRDVEIDVLDHLIITRRGWTSMRGEGLLNG